MSEINLELPEKWRINPPLHSSFVELLPFLKYLSTDVKHCIVKLNFEFSFGYLFMVEGRLIHAIYSYEKLIMGLEGIETIKRVIIDNDSLIEVFTSSPGNIERIAVGSLELVAELRYDNLSTEFVSLEKTIEDCSKEKLNGFIKIKGKNPGYILLDEGAIVSSIYGAETTCIRGERALDYISKITKETSLFIDIFTVDKDILEMIHGPERAGRKWLESIKLKKNIKSLPEDWEQTERMIFYLTNGKRTAAKIYQKLAERNINISVKSYLDHLKKLQKMKKIKVQKG